MPKVDYGGKKFYFCFKDICGLKASNWGTCLILFVTVLFIEKEWSHLIYMIKPRFIKVILFWDVTENRWKILYNHKIFLGKVAENNILWTTALLSIKHLSLIALCWYLIFKILASRFFSLSKVPFYFKNLL